MSPLPSCSAPQKHRRIAVIGGGISGISFLWSLRDYPDYEVHLYEAESRLGGHACTVPYSNNGVAVNVDTGFIAMNEQTYPKFARFLRQLDVPTIPTDMSFGISVNRGVVEWGSGSCKAFLGSWSNLIRPSFWRLCFDILRFNFTCVGALATSRLHLDSDNTKKLTPDCISLNSPIESIGQYLERLNYSKQFSTRYLIPMVAAPWCIDPVEFSRSFPATFLIQFMADHRLLDTLWHTLQWQTFPSGSNSYVDAFTEKVPANQHLHLNTKVQFLRRNQDGSVDVLTKDRGVNRFDHVVLAVHAPQAREILSQDATALESKLLGAFRTSKNICVLHADMTLLPKRINARSSWNCLMEEPFPSQGDTKGICRELESLQDLPNKIAITFDMGRLQNFGLAHDVKKLGNVLVTMNPPRPVSSPYSTSEFFHPLFSSASVQASKQLWRINGVNGVSFAGAWMGYGFHEDGFAAGESAASGILRKDGFLVTKGDTQISKLVLENHFSSRFVVAVIQIVQFCIDIFMIFWGDI